MPQPVRFRDSDAIEAAAALLAATGEFVEVSVGRPLGRSGVAADRAPLARLVPRGWDEDDLDRDAGLRRVAFEIVLAVRDDDPGRGLDRLDRLGSLARDAIRGADLGGGCIPALTRARLGRLDRGRKPPELRSTLLAEFAYLVSPPGG